MAGVALKHIHVYRRAQQADILFGWATRSADTDALFQWNGSGWTEVFELPGTNLIYDARTWLNKIFFCDGKNGLWVYDFEAGTICLIETAPPVQYLLVYQERLVGAGDSRTQAEVEADGQIWPADSNRDRVLFTEALDFATWSPNNFIDTRTGTGEVISGIAVNSITSADRGAQTQLVVFKPSAVMINDGTLGAGDQRFNIVSLVYGCPGYHTITNTTFGLMFVSKETACHLDTNAKEPDPTGFPIFSEFKAVPEDDDLYSSLKAQSAAFFHDNTWKVSIAASNSSVNNKEWWLDLRPAIFPQEQNWYGPHSGDKIMQYELFNGDLIAAEHGTMNMWKLDQEGFYGSMTTPSGARSSVATSSRMQVPGMKTGKLDAYGFVAEMDTGVDIDVEADLDRGTAQESNTWTSPASLADRGTYTVVRPLKRPAHDVQISITHEDESDIEIHTLYVRQRESRKQSVKQSGSSQT